MLKTRMLLLVGAAVLILIIFNLPKAVVDNENDTVQSENPSTNNTSGVINDTIAAHSGGIGALEGEKLATLKQQLNTVENKEKSIIFADSLAKLYLSADKYDSAAKFIEIIADLEPTGENVLRAGLTYYEAYGYAMDPEKRNYMGEKARSFFQRIIDNEPNNLAVKNRLAMTYLSTSNPMQGIAMLREILEQDPKNEQAMFNLGMLSMQSNQYDKAVERFAQLVEMYPKNTQAQFFLGVSYLETGQKEKARQQLEKVKTLDDDPALHATVDSYLEDI